MPTTSLVLVSIDHAQREVQYYAIEEEWGLRFCTRAWEEMSIEVSDVLRLSRKLGFGLRPEEQIPTDFVGWAIGQLTAKPEQIGVASVLPMNTPGQPPAIVPWPEKYTQPIDEQVKRYAAWWVALDALNKKIDPSSPEYEDPRRAIDQKYYYLPWDMTRRAHQAIYGATPVLERFGHFWANHFTVAPKDQGGLFLGHYLDRAIRDNLAGDFGTMLADVTMHPAMLTYLDNNFSVGPNSKNGKSARKAGHFADINENLARELLELHTLSPAGAYTQADVIGIAKILTGWGYDLTKTTVFPGKDRWRPFFKNSHEPGDKTVLGETYKQGPDATAHLLERLAAADATIEHLSTKLARYFLTDVPELADVRAIADVWRQTKGNLPAIHQKVIELAVARPELRKFQQPEVWLYQSLRIAGGHYFFGFDQVSVDHPFIDDLNRNSDKIYEELGQYYWQERQPNGYSDARADWVSPEHLDRRLRFSEIIAKGCHAARDVGVLLDRIGANDRTRALVANGRTVTAKFILTLCSPDMMEA